MWSAGPAPPGLAMSGQDVSQQTPAMDSIIESSSNQKRKSDDMECDEITGKNVQERKKPSLTKQRYEEHHNGPFEIIVQPKDGHKLSPFQIEKILKNESGIEQIRRTGKTITVTCKNYKKANELVLRNFLKQYNAFIQSRKLHSVGVVYVDPEVTEDEIRTEASCE
jgi:hypothetical protein